MLYVANVDQLMLQLGDLIPAEAALWIIQVDRIHGIVDHPIAHRPVFQHLRLRVRFGYQRQRALRVRRSSETIGVLDAGPMMRPRTESSLIGLKVQMRDGRQ